MSSRLQTGSILAHEMMHAYLRLKGTCSHAHKFLVGFTCIPILFSASPSFFLQDTDPLALRLKKASVKSYPTCGLSLKSSPVLVAMLLPARHHHRLRRQLLPLQRRERRQNLRRNSGRSSRIRSKQIRPWNMGMVFGQAFRRLNNMA